MSIERHFLFSPISSTDARNTQARLERERWSAAAGSRGLVEVNMANDSFCEQVQTARASAALPAAGAYDAAPTVMESHLTVERL